MGLVHCDDWQVWRRFMGEALATATAFEIHCWNEEEAAIALALQVGRIKEAAWRGGTVIAGPVDARFCEWLLALPKPSDTDLVNKMTPFFSIFLDNGAGSEHYGTTLTQQDVAEAAVFE